MGSLSLHTAVLTDAPPPQNREGDTGLSMHPKGKTKKGNVRRRRTPVLRGTHIGAGPARRESQAGGAVHAAVSSEKFHVQKYRSGTVTSFPIAGTMQMFSKHLDALSSKTELLQPVGALVCVQFLSLLAYQKKKNLSAKNECIWANIWSTNTIFIPKFFFFRR